MAKVYDALKQVEAERSRQLRVAADEERGVLGENLWRRASGRHGEDAVPMASEHLLRERTDFILGRIDAFEKMAAQLLPDIESNLRQQIEQRLGKMERDANGALALLTNQIRHESAALNRRVSLVLGGIGLLAVFVLLRS